MSILCRLRIWMCIFFMSCEFYKDFAHGCRTPILGKFRLDKHLPPHVERSFPDLPPNILLTEGMDTRFNATLDRDEEIKEQADLVHMKENMLRLELMNILKSYKYSLPFKMQILHEYNFLFHYGEKTSDLYAGGLMGDFDFYIDMDMD